MFATKIDSSRPLLSLLKVNVTAWLLFFVIYNFYSLFWREYATEINYSYISSLFWFVKEWGGWLVLSPIVLYFLETQHKKRPMYQSLIIAGSCFLLLTLSLRILLNEGEYPSGSVAILVIMLPKYLSALMIFSLLGIFV